MLPVLLRNMWAPEHVERFAQLVGERIDALGRAQDLRPYGGPSDTIVREILKGDVGESRQKSTWRKFDSGLDWVPGSSELVLEGGDPTPIDTSPDPGRVRTAAEVGDIEEGAQALTRAMNYLLGRGELEAAAQLNAVITTVITLARELNARGKSAGTRPSQPPP